MNKFLTLGVLSLLVSAPALSAPGNSAFGTVTNFVPRGSGSHLVYISSGATIPTQGCTDNARGVIVSTDPGANAMIASLLLAVSNGYQVSLRVSGCTLSNPDEDAVSTAPKVVKLGLQF
jgi:hypothetical protein